MPIHLANNTHRLEAYRNSHEAWGEGSSVAEYVKKCLQSTRNERCEWWVLTRDSSVLSSLALFSIDFWVSGKQLSGFGIGAVHTRSDARKKGLAGQLCRHAIDLARNRGCQVGLLFSDVSPAYYERMGFKIFLDTIYQCKDIKALAAMGTAVALEKMCATKNRKWIQETYHHHHQSVSLGIARSAQYWDGNLKENDDLEFFSIQKEDENIGYVRVFRNKNVLIPIEIILSLGEDAFICSHVYRALAATAVQHNIDVIRGWLLPPIDIFSHFISKQRNKSHPMLWQNEGLDFSTLCESPRIYSSDYF